MRNLTWRARLRVILGAVLAMAAVVLLPSEAWATSGPSGIVTGSSTGSEGSSATCPTGSAAFTGTTSCHNSSFAIYITYSGAMSFWYGVQVFYGGAWQNLTGSTYGGSNSWTNVYWGAASPVIPDDKPVRYAFINNSDGATLGAYTLRDASTPSTCSNFSNARVSYTGGVLKVRFSWSGSAATTGGWSVYLPGGSSSPGTGTPTATVPTSVLSGSAPGSYGSDTTVSLSLSAGVSARVQSKASSGCYVTATVDLSSSVSDSTGTPGSDSGGNDCGSWDLFCQIGAATRAGFVPEQSSLDQFSSLGATLSSRAPFGYFAPIVGMFTSNASTTDVNSANVANLTQGCFKVVDLKNGNTGPGASHTLCAFASTSPAISWLHDQRSGLAVVAWFATLGPFVVWIWRRLFPVVNE